MSTAFQWREQQELMATLARAHTASADTRSHRPSSRMRWDNIAIIIVGIIGFIAAVMIFQPTESTTPAQRTASPIFARMTTDAADAAQAASAQIAAATSLADDEAAREAAIAVRIERVLALLEENHSQRALVEAQRAQSAYGQSFDSLVERAQRAVAMQRKNQKRKRAQSRSQKQSTSASTASGANSTATSRPATQPSGSASPNTRLTPTPIPALPVNDADLEGRPPTPPPAAASRPDAVN